MALIVPPPSEPIESNHGNGGEWTPEYTAAQARADPAVFVSLHTGKPLHPFHRRILLHLLSHPDSYCELPRGHGKTTLFALLIAWMLGHDPSLRVKIVGCNDPEATKTSRVLRTIVEGAVFQAVFPNAKIEKDENAVEAWRMVHPRTLQRDATVEAKGVFGRAGGRFDILWPDDICDMRNAIINPADRAKVKDAMQTNWYAMADYGAGKPLPPLVLKSGTPYHTDDITADWRKHHGANGSLLRLPCWTDPDGTLRSPWPEAFTHDILAGHRAEGKMGLIGYARAYELVPLSPGMLVFQPEWLRLWTELPPQARLTTIAAVDFAYTAKTTGKDDPDWSVCIVAEIGLDGMVFLTDIVRMRAAFPVFRDAVTQMLAQRKVTRCYAEANGPQRGVADALAEHTRIPIIPMERHTDAMVRATQEQSYIAKGCLHFPSQDGQVRPDFAPLRDEMLTFPAGSHDDCLSACLDIVCAARTGDGQRRMTKPVYTDSPFEHTGPAGGWR